MSAFNKLEYELYALLALNQSFSQFVQPPIVKEESPDWLDTENEIGIEVSRAENTQIGEHVSVKGKIVMLNNTDAIVLDGKYALIVQADKS